MKKLNAKVMEVKLKRGITLPEIADEFGVSDEKFVEMLQREFSEKACKNMLFRLDRNQKSEKKNHRKAIPSLTEKVTAKLETDDQTSEVMTDDQTDEEATAGGVTIDEQSSEIVTTNDQTDEAVTEEKLTAELEEAKQNLDSLERSHKNLVSQRQQIRGEIASYKEVLLQILQKVRESKQKLAALTEEYCRKEEEMQDLNLAIVAEKRQIESLEERLASLRSISIFIYANGELETESGDRIKDIIDGVEDDGNKIFQKCKC